MHELAEPAESWFQKLAESLDLPDSRYETAERSYKAIGSWLEREESEFKNIVVKVYTQGSFRLGTAIQPIGREDDYDLDVVCEFDRAKTSQTQEELLATLGRELKAYADRYGMEPPEGWDRCWTLNYSESAKFHVDVLPCVPDAQRQRFLREASTASLDYVESSVAIADKHHPFFRVRSELWPTSNPNGYAQWFYGRMRTAFDRRREFMRLAEAKADVAEIPEFRVKTPLQLAVQILKRHRDIYFSTRSEPRPSSIVITTLAAQVYAQESTVLSALRGVVSQFPQRAVATGGRYYIPNPSDPQENFADQWTPAHASAFVDWAGAVKSAVDAAQVGRNLEAFKAALSPGMGRELLDAAFMPGKAIATPRWKVQQLQKAKHRQAPAWPVSNSGDVRINATTHRNGFRPAQFANNAPDLALNSELTFQAETNVPPPYVVYWQVVNTGIAATDDGGLRGSFEHPRVRDGNLARTETTKYPGTHSIECFIVKNGFVAARSGLFVVNIGTSRL